MKNIGDDDEMDYWDDTYISELLHSSQPVDKDAEPDEPTDLEFPLVPPTRIDSLPEQPLDNLPSNREIDEVEYVPNWELN